MKTEAVPLDSLHVDPANVRLHGVRNLDAIKASLLEFGQQKPIIVLKDGRVVAGNGTLEAFRDLAASPETTVAKRFAKIQVVRTTLKGVQATRYAIADNRSAELAEWDNDGLASILIDLAADDQAAGLGFTGCCKELIT